MEPQQWWRIGEVARRTGLTTRTLRHYDELGLLVPSGRSYGDYRLYGAADLERLLAIQHLKSLGLSLADIGAALDEPGFEASAVVNEHIAAVEARIEAERDLLSRLHRLRDAAGRGWSDVVDVIALIERLRHPEANVRYRAALDAPLSAPLDELIDVLRTEPEAGVREVATWAVVQQGPAATASVIAHVGDDDPAVRLQMAHVLGKLRDPAGVAALAGLLDDPDAQVAAKAAFSLGQIGGPSALAALMGRLGEAQPEVRDTITRALSSFSLDAVAPLSSVLRGGTAEARAHAADVLGHRGDEAAVEALAGALTDHDRAVQFAALVALGQLHSEAAGRAIASAQGSDDDRTRLLAARLLADRSARPAAPRTDGR